MESDWTEKSWQNSPSMIGSENHLVSNTNYYKILYSVVVSSISYFYPLFGEEIPIWTHIFQVGWFNQWIQLVFLLKWSLLGDLLIFLGGSLIFFVFACWKLLPSSTRQSRFFSLQGWVARKESGTWPQVPWQRKSLWIPLRTNKVWNEKVESTLKKKALIGPPASYKWGYNNPYN